MQAKVVPGFIPDADAFGPTLTQIPGWPMEAATSSDSYIGSSQSNLTKDYSRSLIQITGLARSEGTVTVRCFASRMGVNDNRETCFTVYGTDSMRTCIDASNNIDEVAVMQVELDH